MIELRILKIPQHVDEKTDTWLPEQRILQQRVKLNIGWSEWTDVPIVEQPEE